METLSMCRICVSDDIPLRSIVNTHLNEMYEILTKMPFVTEGNRPLVACDPCCASLENCYELRRRCLSSEERFAQLLRSDVQVDQQMGDMLQKIPGHVKVEMNQEVAEDESGENRSFTHSEDVSATCSFIKLETDIDNRTKALALGLHTEYDIPLDIVKGAPDDVDTDASVSEESHLTEDNIEEPESETKSVVEDKPDQADDQSVNRSSSNKLKQFICDTCQKCFRHAYHLITHIRTHTGEKPFECNVCKKCFTNKCSLDNHIRTHTGEKPYQCNVCKKCFSQKYNLETHTRTHTGEKPYPCHVCKKSFRQKIALNNHIQLHTHTDENLYKCNVCNKCFKHKPTLNSHMRTHADKKYPYQCKICKKYFSQKSHFDAHNRTHTGEKPYECNICKKCFKQKISLDIHMRKHTGEKHPFQCSICMKDFSKKWYLNKHTRTHTDDKPYKCNVCMKCFKLKKTLGRHIRSKHS